VRKSLLLLAFIGTCIYFFLSTEKEIDFNTQVKPIINKKCISCHGGVKQQGGFSLLFRDEAVAKTKSGKYAIVPGYPEKSELILRIKSDDDEERMPYQHGKLTEEEIDIFEKWIKQGAKWGIHWAYLPVAKPDIPNINNEWVTNDIDKFILEKQKENNLVHNLDANKSILLRRLSLDLTGLPANNALANEYLNNKNPDAYNKLIDKFLASSAYGEKWTSMWLDLARYADSKGFESDAYRSIWKYRDWLIKSFNEDLPYDQFLTQQMAGDIMPNSNETTILGTAFHRNAMTNDEGGTLNEEYRTAAVIDRVNTTWSTLMGTSFNCIQCHSHPYDPFKHEDYYKFMAFFNNDADEDLKLEYPIIKNYVGKDSIQYNKLMTWVNKHGTSDDKKYFKEMLLSNYPRYNINSIDSNNVHAHIDNNEVVFRNGGVVRFPEVMLNGENLMMMVYLFFDGKYEVFLDRPNSKPIGTFHLKQSMNLQFVSVPITQTNKYSKIYIKYTSKNPIQQQTGATFLWLKVGKNLPGMKEVAYPKMLKTLDSLMTSWADGTPVLRERPEYQKRKTFVFDRGEWNSPGQEVIPGTPSIMNAFRKNSPMNRYGLSLWLTDKNNPLVARTMVNRVWEQIFGRGLVETLEDLGTQGSSPSHKALLDYLSYQFMNKHQWSIKSLIKEIVMSSTYKQSSMATDEMIKKDPNNIYLSRGPRMRLNAEQIRDQNLAISELLSTKMYGKSVMPYQPAGIWKSPYNDEVWKASTNGDQYRRSIYTHIKRTATFPAFTTFDVGTREVCSTRRLTTNTPLQALNTLNDTTYVIAARNIAKKIDHNLTFQKSINSIFKKMFYMDISPNKLSVLQNLYQTSINHYTKNKEVALKMIANNENSKTFAQEAAWTVTINALMNMDEWLNKN
jgi:hypothetical protein